MGKYTEDYVDERVEHVKEIFDKEWKNVAYIFDIDGTLALIDGRSPYSTHKSMNDIANVPVLTLARLLQVADIEVIFVTGRPEKYRAITMQWLAEEAEVWEEGSILHMRKDDDERKDNVIKKEIYLNEIADKFLVFGIFEDRTRIVNMYRDELHLPVFQVTNGDF